MVGSGTTGLQRERATHSNDGVGHSWAGRLMEEVTQRLRTGGDEKDKGPRQGGCGNKGMGHEGEPGSWGPEMVGVPGTLPLSRKQRGRETGDLGSK